MIDYEKLSKEHFNKQAPVYDSNASWYYSREGKISSYFIKEYLKDINFDKLLDVGCGTAFLIDLLSKKHIVVCSQSFHHYPYQDAAVEEVYRVLKKGGIYILSDSGLGGFSAWFDNNILFKLLKSGDCKITNRKGIEKLLKKHNFEITNSTQMSFMIYTVVGKK